MIRLLATRAVARHNILRHSAFFVFLLSVPISSAIATMPKNNLPDLVVGDVAVNVAANTKIGSIRSGMLCAPNGELRWSQIALPKTEEIQRAISARLKTAERAIVENQSQITPQQSASVKLSLTIDGASMKICTAWLGLGNAPKGSGTLTLTWSEIEMDVASKKSVTMKEELVFAHRDPRSDPGVILDAISRSIEKYTGSVAEVSATK